MATGTLIAWFEQQFFDDNGNPLNGGSILTQLAGTTTNVATYTDVALTVPNANPIVLNAAGRCVCFGTPGVSYKFTLKDSAGVVIKVSDNILAIPTSTSNLDVTGTFGETILAGQTVYLSDGSGSKTAGQWFLADADFTYASTNATDVGMAPSAAASGASGTIRLAGYVTGLSGLTAGTDYYISATAGALTATAPVNARLMGRADSTTTFVLMPQSVSSALDIIQIEAFI